MTSNLPVFAVSTNSIRLRRGFRRRPLGLWRDKSTRGIGCAFGVPPGAKHRPPGDAACSHPCLYHTRQQGCRFNACCTPYDARHAYAVRCFLKPTRLHESEPFIGIARINPEFTGNIIYEKSIARSSCPHIIAFFTEGAKLFNFT